MSKSRGPDIYASIFVELNAVKLRLLYFQRPQEMMLSTLELPAPVPTNATPEGGAYRLSDPSAGLILQIPGFTFDTEGISDSNDFIKVFVDGLYALSTSYPYPINPHLPVSITLPATALGVSGSRSIFYMLENDFTQNSLVSPGVTVLIGT